MLSKANDDNLYEKYATPAAASKKDEQVYDKNSMIAERLRRGGASNLTALREETSKLRYKVGRRLQYSAPIHIV